MQLSSLGARVDLTAALHTSTRRDYLARIQSDDKADCAVVAKQFAADYWDGERRHGYGGYHYDGRWRAVAAQLVKRYGLSAGQSVLDVGCGKGYLLYELAALVPGLNVFGLDVSAYAVAHAKAEVSERLVVGDAASLPFEDHRFDCVISLATLHNLGVADLCAALANITRVLKNPRNAYVMVESYRTEREKVNLLYWQLTCQSFHSVADWEWLFKHCGYAGDYGFIFFE